MAKKKVQAKKKFLVVCSGGNAPGMANCIVAFTKKCMDNDIEPWAAANGFSGIHDRRWWILNPLMCQRAVTNGSALIGTSRCPEFVTSESYRNKVINNIKRAKFAGVVVIGGEGSYKGALELAKGGIPVMTVPATIDNDVASTAFTVGFDTCLNKTCAAVSDITDCFISHHGVALIEIMGRSCPDLTIRTAVACNSTYMVTKYSVLDKEGFSKVVQQGFKHGKFNINFIVTEKIYGVNGMPTLKEIAQHLEKETGLMCRHVVVGYMQRGGTPTARDRLLANYYVNHAVDCLIAGKKAKAMCYLRRQIFDMDLAKAIACKRKSNNRTLVKTFNSINKW